MPRYWCDQSDSLIVSMQLMFIQGETDHPVYANVLCALFTIDISLVQCIMTLHYNYHETPICGFDIHIQDRQLSEM